MAARFTTFLAELKRRKVYRAAVVYMVVGVGVLGAAEVILDPLGLSGLRPAIVLLVLLGFPIALVLAWSWELTPEGIQREKDASREEEGERPLPMSIAVLPFSNLSPDPEQEYFCDGMAEELINSLTQVHGLRVAARTSSFQFRDSAADVREIGRKLGVTSILEGSVRRAGDVLRVTAQLVNTEDGYHLWSETYEREVADVFAIQDEISSAIVATVHPTLVGSVREARARPSTRNMQAYDLFLQGRRYWHQRYEVGLQKGLEYFQEATAMDPDFALPYCGISDSMVALSLYMFIPAEEGRQRAKQAVSRALELNPELGEAYASRGWFRFMCEWDWRGAEDDYRRAIELSPGHAEVYLWYAVLCAAQGRFPEGYEHAARGRALDPLSPYPGSMEGAVAYLARDYHRGAGVLEEVLQQEPGYLFGVFVQNLCLVGLGRFDNAIAIGERGVSLANQSDFFRGLLAVALAGAGKEGEAREILEDLLAAREHRYVSPQTLARVSAYLGDTEPALGFLQESVAERSPFLFSIHQDLAWDGIRHEPRFQELAKQVGAGVVGSSFQRF